MNRVRYVLFGVLVLMLVTTGELWYRYRHAPIPMSEGSVRVRIERGASLPMIAAALRTAGLDLPDWRLQLAVRLRGDARAIRHGVYAFQAPVTAEQVLDRLVRGDVLLAQLTVVEGWTFRQMRDAIARHPELLHDSVADTDADILRRVGATERHPEGLFFPDTYRFPPGSSDYEIYQQAHRLMRRTLEAAWPGRAHDLPLVDPYQALTLASIVEKETGRAEDRAMIASVFTNRLRLRMPLQSDPTTIYGLGARFDGNLRRVHLREDTPHNTYTRRGLPPTPIALPGRASIEAVLNPTRSDALYFVARGDGSSEFSRDLAAHNRAVARYQLRK